MLNIITISIMTVVLLKQLTVKGPEHFFHHWEAITIATHELAAVASDS